jgi:hypothetical protein
LRFEKISTILLNILYIPLACNSASFSITTILRFGVLMGTDMLVAHVCD